MKEMRGEVGKKIPPEKRGIIPRFYDVTWIIFYTIWALLSFVLFIFRFFDFDFGQEELNYLIYKMLYKNKIYFRAIKIC